jgi:hypothetical protein
VLKGRAVELYLLDGKRLFIVADEVDAAKLCEQRGTIYTAAEARRVVQIADPSVVAEVHLWKRKFNATVREFETQTRDPHRPSAPRDRIEN